MQLDIEHQTRFFLLLEVTTERYTYTYSSVTGTDSQRTWEYIYTIILDFRNIKMKSLGAAQAKKNKHQIKEEKSLSAKSAS